MEMTKQRKMLIGVMAVGVLGLVVDRVFLGEPESAAAEDSDIIAEVPAPALPAVPGIRQTPTPPTAADQGESGSLPSYASLTERLVQAQQQAGDLGSTTREDPFALPPQWQTDQSKPQTSKPDEPQIKPTGERLTTVFRLDGTVRTVIDGDKEELMAVISGGGLNNRAVRIGQKVRVADEGGTMQVYKLVEVGPRFVVWVNEANDERIEMRVEEVL